MTETIDLMKRTDMWVKKAKRNILYFPSNFQTYDSLPLTGYAVCFKSLKGITLAAPVSSSVHILKYLATLYDKTTGYFGRTYSSAQIPVKYSNNLYSCEITEYTFFYTNIPADQLEIIIEVIAIEKDVTTNQRKGFPTSIGWIKIPIKTPAPTPQTIGMMPGTPRVLVSRKETEMLKGYLKAEYRLINIPKIAPELKMLIPQNCLCGSFDTIDGLIGERLPLSVEALNDCPELGLIPQCQIYVNNCIVKTPIGFTKLIIENLAATYNLLVKDIKIEEMRLRVGCHNQWDFINLAKLKNSIALTNDADILRCNGIPTIDNAFVHPSTALIFQLEYTVKLIRDEKDIETMKLVASELVVPLVCGSSTSEFDPLNISAIMNTDPEQSITGTSFCTPVLKKDTDCAITIICEISPRQGTSTMVTPAELINAINERKKLEAEHKKQLQDISTKENIEKMSENRSKPTTPHSARSKIEFPNTDSQFVKTMTLTQKPKIENQMPQATVTLIKGQQRPITAASKIMYDNSNIAISKIDSARSSVKKPLTMSSLGIFEPVNMEDDKKDSLKANAIFFEFVSLKLTASTQFPQNIAFSYKFFTFPETHTEMVQLKQLDNITFNIEKLYSIKNWTNTITVNPITPNMKIQYNFDPSSDKDIPQEKALDDYLKYLATNICKIWLIDSESLVNIGYFCIRLSDLLRKREPMRTAKREYQIYLDNSLDQIGSISMILQSVGRKAGTPCYNEEEISILAPKTQRKGKTKIKSKPLQMADLAKVPQMALRINDNSLYGKQDMLAAEERRKAELVYQYKLRTQAGDAGFYHTEDISKYRTLSRAATLDNFSGNGTEKITLPPITYTVGEVSFYPLIYTNPYDKDTMFQCFLYDPEARNEFQLISDPSEWKYYCSKGNFSYPPDWTILTGKKGFVLHGGEQIPLLFRILASGPPQKIDRFARITIQNVETQGTEQINEIKLVYKETYFNSIFQFNVPENRAVDLSIVPDIHTDILNRSKSFKCSNPSAEIKLEESYLDVSFISVKSPYDNELYITLYGDQYYFEPICVIYILAKSYTCFDITDIAGKRFMQNISIAAANEGVKKVKLYTNDLEMIRLGEFEQKPIDLHENKTLNITLNIGTNKPLESQAILHAIDIDSNRIYRRWLFRFKTELPTPIQEYNIKAMPMKPLSAFFEYKNNSSQKRTYEIISSDSALLRINEKILVLTENEMGHVPITIIKRKMDTEKDQAYVFVNEMSSGKVDTILFNIVLL